MRCKDCISLLEAYLDGELTPAERAEVEARLAECEGCRRELAALRLALDLVKTTDPADDPGEAYWVTFAARVQERVKHLPAPHVEKEPWYARWVSAPAFRLAGGAIAVAAIILGALIFGRPHGTKPTEVTARPEAPQTLAAPAPERVREPASPSGGAEKAAASAPARNPAAEAAPSGGTAGGTEAAAPPTVALGMRAATEEAKPARGGIAYIQAQRAAQAREEFKALLVPPEASADSVARGLREEEMRLRRELGLLDQAAPTGEARTDGRRIVRLADVLYQLALRTHDPRDLNRALLFWRPEYDRIAAAIGDSTARARLGRMEAILLDRSVTPSR